MKKRLAAGMVVTSLRSSMISLCKTFVSEENARENGATERRVNTARNSHDTSLL